MAKTRGMRGRAGNLCGGQAGEMRAGITYWERMGILSDFFLDKHRGRHIIGATSLTDNSVKAG